MIPGSNLAPPRVLIHYDRADMVLDVLAERHPDVIVTVCRDYASLPALIEVHRPDIVFTVRFAGTPGFPREAILGCGSVEWVSVGGSGTDHLAPWDPARITVTNAAGVAADVMAQYVMAGIYAFGMGFPTFAARQRMGEWATGRVEPVAGKTALVVGLGRTGAAVVDLARRNGLKVLGIRARPRPMLDIEEVRPPEALHDLLKRADYVVICVPLTAATRGLIGAAAFSAMRASAVLIDVSRGGVVDEEALVRALRMGAIRGAVRDVFSVEPLPSEHPLWAMENVILTPHCSSVFEGWDRRAMEMFCDNLDRWRHSSPLENVVDPQRG